MVVPAVSDPIVRTPESELIYVEGQTRHGSERSFYTHVNQLPGLVERLYRMRWRWLSVRLGGRDGVEVGRIARSREGKRTFWTLIETEAAS